jgi:hypothetical protein
MMLGLFFLAEKQCAMLTVGELIGDAYIGLLVVFVLPPE